MSLFKVSVLMAASFASASGQGMVKLDGTPLVNEPVIGETWFSAGGHGYKNIPMWLATGASVVAVPPTPPGSSPRLTLSCPNSGGFGDTSCTFTVVLYACSPCVGDNGGLSSILASLGFTSGSCGPLVAASPGGKTGKTAFYRKTVKGGAPDLHVDFTGGVRYAAVFLSYGNTCSAIPPIPGMCDLVPGCKQSPAGTCEEAPLCPFLTGPRQPTTPGQGSGNGCLPCIGA